MSGHKVAAKDPGIGDLGESDFESQAIRCDDSSSVDSLRVAVRRLGEALF